MMGSSLDDQELYPRLDPSGLRHRLLDFPDQCRRAWQEAREFPLSLDVAGCKQVLVAGMGGSAIGGDLLADLASTTPSAPVIVIRGYRIPYVLDQASLVLSCSYSGNTEETLATFRQATSQDVPIIAISSGGTLGREAQGRSIPFLRIDYEGEPRSALGYSFIVPAVLLTKLGLLNSENINFEDAFGAVDSLLPTLGEAAPADANPAKKLAQALLNRLIVVYGSGIYSSVSRRWKTQFNENSKVPAYFESLPEAHHNAVVGFSLPDAVKELTTAVFLEPHDISPRMARRYEVTRELLDRESVPHHTIRGAAGSPLAQMLTTTLIGDYTSYYLAILQGVDPSPVNSIAYIRERMGQPYAEESGQGA
jgi:glucose/mannose-6-phosphate isomerase